MNIEKKGVVMSSHQRTVSESAMGSLSFFTLFVIGTDTFLVAPLLPLLQEEFGVPLAQSGWLVSAYALGYALFALVAGPISDHHNRRRVLLAGVAAFALLTCACGLTWDFWSMFTTRFLAGVGAAFVSPQIWAAIPMVVSRGAVIKVMGHATAGLAIAQVAGIPIGSWLSTQNWRLPFFTIAGLSVLLWLTLLAWFPSVPPAAPTGGDGLLAPYRRVLASRTLAWSLVAYLVFQAGCLGAFSFIGSWLAKDFGATQNQIGTSMMIIGLGQGIGSFAGPPLVSRIGERTSLWSGIVALGAGFLLASAMPSRWAATTAFAATLLVGGFLLPVMMGQLQSNAGQARGTVSSLSNSAMYLGTAITGGIGGTLLTVFPGYWGISIYTAVTFALALAIYRFAGVFRNAPPPS
ncbi:MFS transporter [Arachnia propionica]|uniref:MFS transporter n=1 Tax=Arachnia propionica TaxID=1750 RepID=UPI00242E0EFD|nr:MFS transporter [Arachnia propionica]